MKIISMLFPRRILTDFFSETNVWNTELTMDNDWICFKNSYGNQGYLPFTRENRKFQLENQMVRAIPFGQLQKIWAVIQGDAIFLLFEVSLADVDIFYNNSLSRNLVFNCFMFMPEISNRMVFVNGKHP